MPLFLPPPLQKNGVTLRFVSFDELYHHGISSQWTNIYYPDKKRCRHLPGSFNLPLLLLSYHSVSDLYLLFSSPKIVKKRFVSQCDFQIIVFRY